jgi:hypothetical protein
MSVPPLPGLDALSLDELKKLVVQLLVRVSALKEENRQPRAENGRLKALQQKPKPASGGKITSERAGQACRDQTGAPAAAQTAEWPAHPTDQT